MDIVDVSDLVEDIGAIEPGPNQLPDDGGNPIYRVRILDKSLQGVRRWLSLPFPALPAYGSLDMAL